jgi:membrane associated rhomboid family serine protease
MLVAVHLAVRAASDPSGILQKAGASAGAIASGEFYRIATALTLHADVPHLAGNILGIAIFATAVCHLTGTGVGWTMILASGLLGNLANAWLVEPAHLSVGASTAVFGAVGILSAAQFYRKRSAGDSRFRAWLPLAGGLALLAFLGSGAHADLTAHLFGFASGIGLGLFFAVRIRRPPAPAVQRRLIACSAAILAVSWLAALS